jgi:hypothetical protein
MNVGIKTLFSYTDLLNTPEIISYIRCSKRHFRVLFQSEVEGKGREAKGRELNASKNVLTSTNPLNN